MSVRSRGPLLALGLASVGALSIASTAGAGTTVPSDDTTAATTGDTAAATDDTTAGTTGDTTNPLETPFEIGDVPEDMSIVYVPGLTGNPFYNTVACGAENRAEELGIEFTYQGAPTFDVALQSGIVSALIGEDPDAILISLTDPDAMIPPLLEAKDAGINLIGIDGDLSDREILATNIQSDNLVGGALAARSLVEAVGEDVGGDVLGLSNNAGSPIGEQREQGFTDELAKYPAFNYLGTQYTDNEQAAGGDDRVDDCVVERQPRRRVHDGHEQHRGRGDRPARGRDVARRRPHRRLRRVRADPPGARGWGDHRPRRAVPVRRRRPRRRHRRRPGERARGAPRPADGLRVRHAGELGDS